MLEAVRGSGIRGDIAVDDISISPHSCEGETEEGGRLPWHCSFEEEDLCGQTNMEDDDFDWTRTNRNTPTANTGPDSASDGEYFVFIEASSPRREGDRAL